MNEEFSEEQICKADEAGCVIDGEVLSMAEAAMARVRALQVLVAAIMTELDMEEPT